jgi:WD40 repeat protein
MTSDTSPHPWRARAQHALTLALTLAALGASPDASTQTPPPADPAAALPLAVFATSEADRDTRSGIHIREERCSEKAFSPDGALLALYTDNHALNLIRTADGATLHHIETDNICSTPLFSPDGKLLLLGDRLAQDIVDTRFIAKSVQAISTASGTVVGRLPPRMSNSRFREMAFSLDGNRLATVELSFSPGKRGYSTHHYKVELWDTSSAITTGAWPKAPLWDFTISGPYYKADVRYPIFFRDGSTLVLINNPQWGGASAWSERDLALITLNATTGKPFTDWHGLFKPIEISAPDPAIRVVQGPVMGILRSALGDTIYLFTYHTVLRWDLDALTKDPTTPPIAAHIQASAFSAEPVKAVAQRPDGTFLAVADDLFALSTPYDDDFPHFLLLNSDGVFAKQLAPPSLITEGFERAQHVTLSPVGDLVFVRGAPRRAVVCGQRGGGGLPPRDPWQAR